MNEELTPEQLARKLYYSLDDLNEYGRLLKLGSFPGSDAKSVIKCDEFFRNLYKSTLEQIEINEWYKTEKEAIQKINIKEVMHGGSGEYDPNYKVNMHDVFKKVVK